MKLGRSLNYFRSLILIIVLRLLLFFLFHWLGLSLDSVSSVCIWNFVQSQIDIFYVVLGLSAFHLF
jgi:hypothetical protein